MAISLPDEYSYVLLAATSTFFVNMYHTVLTSSHRKASGIKYPTTYASDEAAAKDPKAYAFNCAQRAHANFTENLTPAITALLIAGLQYPVLAAGLGGAWSLARVLYAGAYTSKGPAARAPYAITASAADFVLKGTAVYAAVQFALNK